MIGSLRAIKLPKLTLIVGGARSGKSALAEQYVLGSGLTPVYIATAEAGDAEMADRIERHRQDRGTGWITLEAPHALADAVRSVPKGSVTLVDCATLWLSNRMLADADILRESAELRQALAASLSPVVVVSNEVGWGIVPDNALARRFRDAQGRLNQTLAADADLVVGVMAGLPFALKGALPDLHEA